MDDERRVGSGAEKIWNEAKARHHLAFKRFLRGLGRIRGIRE
jgi:hypothetical protein